MTTQSGGYQPPLIPRWMAQYHDVMGVWVVVEGEWEPGHPERLKAKCWDRDIAEMIAADHNARW